jgi:chromosome segregation ATPase
MDLTEILTFFGIFVSIVLILISIAYYGIKEPSYDEALGLNSSNAAHASDTTATKPTKKSKKDSKKSNSNTGDTRKKRAISVDAHHQQQEPKIEQEEAEEEDPIVIIPDPFSLQVTSRFAGASRHSKKDHQPTTTTTTTTVTTPKAQQEDFSEKKVVASHQQQVAAFASTIENKVKPKATVKPNQAASNYDFQLKTATGNSGVIKEDFKQSGGGISIETAAASAVAAAAEHLRKKAMDEAQLAFNLKVKDLNVVLSDKSKQIEILNSANLKSKGEIASLSAKIKELDVLKHTNQIIQQEMTKWTQNCMQLEKTKVSAEKREEAYKKKVEKLESKIHSLESAPPSAMLSSNDNDDSTAAKLNDLMSELTSLKADHAKKLQDSNEKSSHFFDRLQTQEALTKQLELQLEIQSKLVKQKEIEVNNLSQQTTANASEKAREIQEACQRLEALLNQKIEELNAKDSALNEAQEKNKTFSMTIETTESKVANLEKKLSEMNSNSLETQELDARLNQKIEELNAKNSALNESQEKNKSFSTTIEATESKVVELEKKISDINSDFETRLAQITQDLNAKDSALNQEHEKNKTILQNVESNESKVTQLEKSLSEISTKNTEFETSLNQKNEELNAKDSALNEVQEKNKTTESKIAELELRLAEVNSNNTDLSNKNAEIESLSEKCKSLTAELNEASESVKSTNSRVEQLTATLNETIQQQMQVEAKLQETLHQQTESQSKQAQEIQSLSEKSKLFQEELAESNQKLQELELKRNEEISTLQTNCKSLEDLLEQSKLSSQDSLKQLEEQHQKKDEEIQNLLTKCKSLEDQLSSTTQNLSLLETTHTTTNNIQEQEIKCLKGQLEQSKHMTQNLTESNQCDKAQLNELTGRIQELEKKLSVSTNIINLLKTTTKQPETNLKEIQGENEDLKGKNQRLKSGLAVTEKSIAQLEDVIKTRETSVLQEVSDLKLNIEKLENEKKLIEESGNKMVKKISKELKKEIELRKELQQKNADLELLVDGDRVVVVHHEKSNGSGDSLTAANGEHFKSNGNGHEDTSFDSKLIDVMKENERLKQLLEEEIKTSKVSLTERAKIRDLIKKGQESLEHEKQELHERFDAKILGEFEIISNGVNGTKANGNTNGNGTDHSTAGLNGNGNGNGVNHATEKI